MQTLFIPDVVHIDIIDQYGKPFRQTNILIGIQTFAKHKNDIDISPFLSDPNGRITIRRDDLKNRADIFTSYGLMDYVSIEDAKPEVNIYYWGNKKIDRCINYWSMLLKNKKTHKPTELEIKLLGHLSEELKKMEKRETEDLEIFSSCFNRTAEQDDDIILTRDSWDSPSSEKTYVVALHVGRKKGGS
ncbi:hypothetical protein [Pinibacter soli]|uniref:Uncharacterized protein n=1 Tax=Pinibacter soli TaxID=3044211 RepID=A0ABT6RG99_9BACT|nr:hypothetical protein [Pinibacter soli]MDI3320894.1 hypothetical protein [Pinibacter soli]